MFFGSYSPVEYSDNLYLKSNDVAKKKFLATIHLKRTEFMLICVLIVRRRPDIYLLKILPQVYHFYLHHT